MMDVYDFLNLATNLSGAVVTVFDITSGNVVYDSTKSAGKIFDLYDLNEIGSYEVESYDLFIDRDGSLCIEVNIEMDEDDDE